MLERQRPKNPPYHRVTRRERTPKEPDRVGEIRSWLKFVRRHPLFAVLIAFVIVGVICISQFLGGISSEAGKRLVSFGWNNGNLRVQIDDVFRDWSEVPAVTVAGDVGQPNNTGFEVLQHCHDIYLTKYRSGSDTPVPWIQTIRARKLHPASYLLFQNSSSGEIRFFDPPTGPQLVKVEGSPEFGIDSEGAKTTYRMYLDVRNIESNQDFEGHVGAEFDSRYFEGAYVDLRAPSSAPKQLRLRLFLPSDIDLSSFREKHARRLPNGDVQETDWSPAVIHHNPFVQNEQECVIVSWKVDSPSPRSTHRLAWSWTPRSTSTASEARSR